MLQRSVLDLQVTRFQRLNSFQRLILPVFNIKAFSRVVIIPYKVSVNQKIKLALQELPASTFSEVEKKGCPKGHFFPFGQPHPFNDFGPLPTSSLRAWLKSRQ
jgi:hypothetical protein